MTEVEITSTRWKDYRLSASSRWGPITFPVDIGLSVETLNFILEHGLASGRMLSTAIRERHPLLKVCRFIAEDVRGRVYWIEPTLDPCPLGGSAWFDIAAHALIDVVSNAIRYREMEQLSLMPYL